MNNKQFHLNLIQQVINRMAKDSFLIREWTVVLISALFALAAANSNQLFVYLAYFPAIAFWVLDGYYLWQERLFRVLFDHVRELKDDEIDFAMNTSIVKEKVSSWDKVMFSKTLSIFHGTIFGTIVLISILTIFLY